MILLTKNQIAFAKSQIDWARYHAGTYRHDDPLDILKQHLMECNVINDTEAALLRDCIRQSINHIRRYDYGVNNEGLRLQALTPLEDFLTLLKGS